MDSFRPSNQQKIKANHNYMDAKRMKSKVRLPSLGANMYIITTSTRILQKTWRFCDFNQLTFHYNLTESQIVNSSIKLLFFSIFLKYISLIFFKKSNYRPAFISRFIILLITPNRYVIGIKIWRNSCNK